jgi:predicted nucleic acid-binding Zn ribbon protein
MPEDGRGGRPKPIAGAIRSFLAASGLSDRVQQAGVVDEWPRLVGPQVAAVTEAQSVSPDGVLFVAVKTHAWMSELTMLERDLLEALNRGGGRPPVRRIRWRLMR